MYEAFFGFRQRPFPAVPNVQFYFPVEAFEQAKANLIRAIDRAEGVGLIVGPAGSGKSLLCALVAEHFQLRQQFQIAMLSSARLCSRRALLQNILFELKLPYRDMEEGELRLSLIDHLEPSDRCPNGMLLVVDEAHTLPLRLLEEIRMITNLVRGGQPRVRLLLAGSPEIEERLATPKLASFQQRVAARCYLHHLSQSETAELVRHQLRVAGTNLTELFDDSALAALYHATDGVPRLINQVCDHALVLAYTGGVRSVTARGIEEAWADLQQLPAPWPKSDTESSRPTVIEFGELEPRAHVWQDFEEQFTHELPESNASSSHLQAYDGEHDEEDFEFESAAAAKTTAAQPVLPPAVDPFGGSFADEEVVVDRFAAWDAEIRKRPHVRSSDSEQIAAALRSAVQVDASETVEQSLVKSVQEMHSEAKQVIASSPPALDPTAPLVIAPQIVGGFGSWDEQWWTAHVLPPTTIEASQGDDRDLLVIDDGPLPVSSANNGNRTVRQEYRQLFGQLRGS